MCQATSLPRGNLGTRQATNEQPDSMVWSRRASRRSPIADSVRVAPGHLYRDARRWTIAETTTPSAATEGRWRPIVAAAMSLVVPGAGQWYLGRRLRAVPFLVVSGALVASTVVVWSRGSIFTLQLAVQPRWLGVIIAGNVAIAAFRLWASLDSYLVGREAGRALPVPVMLLAAGVLGAALIAPHVLVESKASALLDLLENVFATEEIEQEPPVWRVPELPGAILDPDPVPPPLMVDPLDPVHRPGLSGWSGLPEPMLPVPVDEERITVLLVGGDAGPGRSGLRTDAMVIASVDTRTNRAVLITVSRELTGFPLPQAVEDADRVIARQAFLWDRAVAAEEAETSRATQPLPEELDPCCWLDRINALYPFTRDLSRVYPGSPDPGLEALRASLSEGLGLRIDYYVMVDMAGFVDVVDAIGGVRVTSRESMHMRFSPAKEGEEWFELDIDPGVHHFDGRTALAYLRNRSGSSDIDRTRRQRCLMREVAGQLDAFTVLRRLEVISAVMQRHTTTNVPLRLLPTLVAVVGALDRTDIQTVAVQQGRGVQERDYRGLPVVDLDAARSVVRRALDGLGVDEPPAATDECA